VAQKLIEMAEALLASLQAQAGRATGLAAPITNSPLSILNYPLTSLLNFIANFLNSFNSPTSPALLSPTLFDSPIGGQSSDPIPYGVTTITYQ
jgi:hypothetical protein